MFGCLFCVSPLPGKARPAGPQHPSLDGGRPAKHKDSKARSELAPATSSPRPIWTANGPEKDTHGPKGDPRLRKPSGHCCTGVIGPNGPMGARGDAAWLGPNIPLLLAVGGRVAARVRRRFIA